MMRGVNLIFLLTALVIGPALYGQGDVAEAYIKRYQDIAVKEMHRTGVPASITMAQAILESDYGRSKLAENANNHFGIK